MRQHDHLYQMGWRGYRWLRGYFGEWCRTPEAQAVRLSDGERRRMYAAIARYTERHATTAPN